MTSNAGTLIIGASAAGLAVAENLRSEGFDGCITLVGREPHLPYDRPPLSKQLLSGDWTTEQSYLRPKEQLDGLRCEWILGTSATALDVAGRSVRLSDGRDFGFDSLVIATGLRPRMLSTDGQGNVFPLYKLDDVERTRACMGDARKWLVVGGGFLANESAASLRGMGLDVTLAFLGVQALPFHARSILSSTVKALHAGEGVELLADHAVASIDCVARQQEGKVLVRFESGADMDADAVVVAIGAQPSTEWLLGSSLRVEDGVVCDEFCQAAPHIWAAGDVCRWPHGPTRSLARLPTRTNATEQGRVVARNILGMKEAYDPLVYKWTDIHGVKFQFVGEFPPDAEVELRRLHDRGPAGGCMELYRVAGRLTGAVAWAAHREFRSAREEIVANREHPESATLASGASGN